MRKLARFALVFAVLLLSAGAEAAAPSISLGTSPSAKLTIRTDRPGAVYEKGEAATFLIELTEARKPVTNAEADCELSTDEFWKSEKTRVAIVDGKARVTASRDGPCILWMRLTYTRAEGEPVRTVAGVAFSPEELRPSMPPPDDFDEFWQQQKARLAKVPLNPKLEPINVEDDSIELYSVTMDNINDTRIYGYLAKPKGREPFPAFLQVQWAGVYSLQSQWVTYRAQDGFLALNINAHAIENAKPEQYYEELTAGALKGYAHQGRESRQSCYFLRMYLSCHRAADYLASRPEWDGKHFIVYGGSQGGAQAIVTAALNPQVTAVAAGVPALCDQTARALPDRAPGWPRMVAVKDGKLDPIHAEVARYFDVVNFARKVNIPAVIGTGFADLTCPSSSVYAAYNVIPGPKRMVLDPLSGHGGAKPNWQRELADFVRRQRGE